MAELHYMGKESIDDLNALPPPRTSIDRREKLAEEGDFLGLFRTICSADPMSCDYRHEFRQLQKAVARRAQADPLGVADEVLSHAIGGVTYLALRVEFSLQFALAAHDRKFSKERDLGLPREVKEYLAPALASMQGHLATLAQSLASVRRQRELCVAKRLENERRAADEAERRLMQRQSSSVVREPQADTSTVAPGDTALAGTPTAAQRSPVRRVVRRRPVASKEQAACATDAGPASGAGLPTPAPVAKQQRPLAPAEDFPDSEAVDYDRLLQEANRMAFQLGLPGLRKP